VASVSQAPSLFLRNATGLVKGWSGFDAFAYSFMSVNLVTLGMFFSFLYVSSAPDGSMLSAVLLSGIAVTFLCIAYAGLIAVMPRAGGDYVWLSRVMDGIPGIVTGAVMVGIGGYLVGQAIGGDSIALVGGVLGLVGGAVLGYLKGGLAFVLAATGWWFILAQWAPIYASILRVEFLQPLAALIGWNDGVSFFAGSNQWGVFTASIIVIILTTGLCSLGMAGYARIQKWSLWIGLIGLAVICVLMLVSSQADFQTAFDKASSSLFNVSGAYNAIVTAGGGTNTAINPFGIGSGTFVLIPFMMFWILYPNWGATLYGEVRGSSDFKKVLRGMLAGTWVTVGLAIVFLLLAAKTFGWAFFSSTGAQVYSQTPVIPIWGYPPLLASFLFDNRIFQIAVVVVFGAWFLGWSGTLFLSSTRMIFAAAFDRVLPEAAARVSDRSHVPYVALILIMVPSVVVSAVYAFWPPFVTYTLDASLVIGVMFFGTAIAATILPWWKPALYQKSPIAKYAILGIPVISIGGFLTVLVLGWTIAEWLENATYGIGVETPGSIIYLGILYGIAIVVYVVAFLVRRSQGVDLALIHSEIPAE
jgi:basic amino acid/polyamine antiporter, APA family